jgi:hypothetical protein
MHADPKHHPSMKNKRRKNRGLANHLNSLWVQKPLNPRSGREREVVEITSPRNKKNEKQKILSPLTTPFLG